MYKIHPKEIYDLNQNSYTFGILDHDHKGLTGRGTKYWLTAVIDGELIQREYTIMDLIENAPIASEIESIKIHYLQRQKEIEEEREREYKRLSELMKRSKSIELKTLNEFPLILTIDNFLSDSACKMLINETEELKYIEAPVTLDGNKGVFKIMPDVRNNTRVILDDTNLADFLIFQLKKYLPETFKNEWELTKLNSRFRFYRYEKGQTFKPHIDGKYIESEICESKLTLLIYLSDNFIGGETTFFDKTEDQVRFKVIPKLGQVLVFDHHQLHSGDPVKEGIKYVLRTDVMYTKK